MTFEQLEKLIAKMTNEQKKSTLTCEIFDGKNYECFPASLRICNGEHNILDDRHPVISIDQSTEYNPKHFDYPIESLAKEIGLS